MRSTRLQSRLSKDEQFSSPRLSLVPSYPKTRMRPHEFTIYDALMRRRNVTRVSYDDQVAHLGAALRQELAGRGKTLSVPDLIHLATAVYGGATELHTTDMTLLGCDGEAAVKGVRILTPKINQYRLF